MTDPRWVGLAELGVSVLAVTASVAMELRGSALLWVVLGWGSLPIGALLALDGIAKTIRPARLVLDETGFVYHQPSGKGLRQRWDDGSPFSAVRLSPGARQIVWTSRAWQTRKPRASRLTGAVVGGNMAMAPHADGLDLRDLAIPMTRLSTRSSGGRWTCCTASTWPMAPPVSSCTMTSSSVSGSASSDAGANAPRSRDRAPSV